MALSSDQWRSAAVQPNGRDALMAGNGLAMLSMLAWAAAFPAAEILLDDWPPLAIIVARMVLSMSVLLPVWWLIDGTDVLHRANWGRGVWVGGLGFGMGMYLFLVAQALTDPVTVALIASASPVAAAIIEFANRLRRITMNFLLGLGLTVIGGFVATNASGFADIGLGAALAVVSAFLFAWGSFAAVRDFPDLSPLGRTTITFAGGCLLILVVFAASLMLGYDVLPRRAPNSADVVPLLIYALGGMALSQVLFLAAVGRIGIALASLHINAAPFYVMLLMLALGGVWNWAQAAGAMIVGLGVIFAQRT